MATDWLKVEKTTPRKPEVLRIATIMDIHPDHAFGLCFRFWCWCDDNLRSANGGGVSLALVDALVDRSGFSDALVKVGWLRTDGETFEISNFERHLSKSAKTRGLTAIRVAQHELKTNDPSVSSALAELELDRDTKKGAPPVQETKPKTARLSHAVRPTLAEVQAYCQERKNNVDPEQWMDHHIANGWRVGSGTGKPMKDWKATVRTWEKNGFGRKHQQPPAQPPKQRMPDMDEILRRGYHPQTGLGPSE